MTPVRSSLSLLLGLGISGCFTGADALGLPCEQDGDCGRSHSCVDGFCGGPPDTTVATGAATETTGGGPGSSTAPGTTTEASTGDGSSTGATPECGNGIPEVGEDCDPGPADSVDCDADCTVVECEDGYTNVAAGECPMQGGGFQCAPGCRAVLLYDDMGDQTASEGAWTVARPDIGGVQIEDDAVEWFVAGDTWRTGAYSCDSGVVDLLTPAFSLANAPEGMHIELRFSHRHNLDPNPGTGACTTGSPNRDGGILSIVGAGDAFDSQVPMIYPGTGVNTASCAGDANPLSTGDAFTRQTSDSGFVEVIASLEAYEGMSDMAQLRFRMGYDCGNCGFDCALARLPPEDYAWRIDEIIVEYVPDA